MSITAQLPLSVARRADGGITTLTVYTSTKTETLTPSASAGSLGTVVAPPETSSPYSWKIPWTAPTSDQVATISVTTNADASSASWSVDCRTSWPQPGCPTLTGPTSGTHGVQSGPFILAYPSAWFQGMPAITVTPVSTVSGDTFQASSGGGNVASVSLSGGSTSVQFWVTPATAGTRRISVACSFPHDASISQTFIVFTAS